MRTIIAISALAATIIGGCASQPADDMAAKEMPKQAAAPAPKATAAKPAMLTGASTRMLANTCAGCHGPHGQSGGPAIPSIAGMDEEYLVEVMQAYKQGERKNTIMGRIAKGYSDAEIEQMAKYFSQQEYVGWIQAGVGPKARAGQRIHENLCEKCHEDEGTLIEDIPLGGQWMDYVAWTIADYLEGHNTPTKGMSKSLKKLIATHPEMSKAEMAENLSHFYASRRAAGYQRVSGPLK